SSVFFARRKSIRPCSAASGSSFFSNCSPTSAGVTDISSRSSRAVEIRGGQFKSLKKQYRDRIRKKLKCLYWTYSVSPESSNRSWFSLSFLQLKTAINILNHKMIKDYWLPCSTSIPPHIVVQSVEL
ncbi:hypothetical protein QQP08_007708, partial [Theobroma cacao]